MPSPTRDTVRFIRGWIGGRHLSERDGSPVTSGSFLETGVAGVRTREVVIGSGTSALHARWYGPRFGRFPAPGWVLLHGVTLPGPDHPAIVRFAAALARSGAVVLVPDIPTWRRLDLDPRPAQTALARAAEQLATDPRVRPGGVVLVGLSLGFPQVLRVGAELARKGFVRGLGGFGSYCRLANTLRFGLTGQFRWRGRTHYLRPDPYGRWVVAANYLHRVPGCEDAECVSRALHRLAVLAGERRILSWDPGYDVAKDDLERSIPAAHRPLFRLFAPPADREPRPDPAREMTGLLADAAHRTHPELAPTGPHGVPPPPVRLLHGRRDHLIPFTETLALERLLRKRADVSATITGLFAHSRESGPTASRIRESAGFFKGLKEMMALQYR
ncbi:MAG: hypothetical protein OXQ93_07180 [Gemmatimonadota bacterium]|nr:hypothetical protein [Gemmatimonadota bacterium]